MIRYLRRVQAARHEEQAAQMALDFDYQDRIDHDGPWGEDDTYLRLNDNAAHASANLLHVALRRIIDEADPLCRSGIPVQVGMILRHCTQTERGAELAAKWDQRNGVDTASIEII